MALFTRTKNPVPAVTEVTRPATQNNHIIEVDQVVKTYTSGNIKVQALRGVSLDVSRGEMLAIMGASGCGKTTLLNCISGLDRIDSGAVRIEGVDLASLNDRQRTKYRAESMGFIFQTYNLLPLVVSGVNAVDARKRALAALDRVGLADRANNWPSQLSGGQRQRVTIARSLVNEPAIVWADEPTGALDSKTANEIMTLIETLNREHNQTFVIVTHDQGVGRRCHRLISMSDGEIVGEETN